jgi:hypothetical protein
MLQENIVENAAGDGHIVKIVNFMKLLPVFQPMEALLANSKRLQIPKRHSTSFWTPPWMPAKAATMGFELFLSAPSKHGKPR